MKLRIAFLLVVAVQCLTAQDFIKNKTNRALSFKEMQLQFNTYKQSNDLTQKKHWKNFKRWETDMQLHTNGVGEPAGFAEYINEVIAVSNAKQQSSGPSVWAPSGPNVVPNNLTGYMAVSYTHLDVYKRQS